MKLVDTYSKSSVLSRRNVSSTASSSDAKYPNGDVAHGGYSDGVRAHERFVFPIPDGVDLADAGGFEIKDKLYSFVSFCHFQRRCCVPV